MVIGAFIIYPKVQASARVDTESKNLATITTGIKSLFGSQATYIGLSLDSANNAQIFPDNMVLSSTRARYNAWRREFSLSAEQDSPSNVMGNSFSITYKAVPEEECAKLVSSVAGYFYIIKVATTVVKPANETLDIDSLTTQCDTPRPSDEALRGGRVKQEVITILLYLFRYKYVILFIKQYRQQKKISYVIKIIIMKR